MESLKDIFSEQIGLKNWMLKASLKKKLVILSVILVVGWFGGSRILGRGQSQPQYQTAVTEKGTLITSVSASGTVSQGSSVNIVTNATGVVNNVYVKNGTAVSQGDKIADITLDISSQQKQQAAWSSYLSAKNSFSSAQAKINSLQSALFKANQAFINDKGIANPSDQQKADPKYIEENAEWLQAEADYKNQTAVIAQTQVAVSSAWLSYVQLSSTITAPYSGVVSGLTLTPGLSITGSSGTSASGSNGTNINASSTLGTIILEQGKLQANVNLTEIDVVSVKTGQKVTLTLDAFPDKTFTGVVSAVNTGGIVSSSVTTYPATITFDTAVNNIYPNMSVNAKIIISIKNDAILVPSGAVQIASGESLVRVLKNGQVSSVPVEVGSSNDTQTEIISGIKEGDTVVSGVVNVSGNRPGQNGASPFGGRGFGGFGGGNIRVGGR
ncbi:MAG: efflux RND transporter periplasmic adaptor subunit [Candidatus Levybacteria bacterium]|nr:efflux RND transporter periplasmic adaptor subunit [Candidatus Levybacteria bacterium]